MCVSSERRAVQQLIACEANRIWSPEPVLQFECVALYRKCVNYANCSKDTSLVHLYLHMYMNSHVAIIIQIGLSKVSTFSHAYSQIFFDLLNLAGHI